MRLFIAPVVLGAGEARAVLEGEGAKRIAEGQHPLVIEHQHVGEDLLITARLREW
jgi:riboflavin biosynthesis pyrimidine reductase